MSSNTPFEVPKEMRAFAEQSVAQAKQAFDSFMNAARQAVDAAESQALTARSGAKEVGEAAIRHAERNIASSFELAQKLLRAKDAQEVLALHADYVRSQVSALTEQAKDLSQRAGKMAGPGR